MIVCHHFPFTDENSYGKARYDEKTRANHYGKNIS